MTIAAATFTQSQYPDGQDMTQRRMIFYGQLAIGASPLTYQPGGLPLAITGALPGVSAKVGKPGPVPLRADMDSRNGSGYLYFWTTKDLWTAVMKGNVLVAGQSIQDPNGYIQTVTTAGTAGSGTEPTWNTNIGGTTTDNSVTWTNKGPGNGIVQIFQSGAGSGTISAPTITTLTNVTTTAAVYVNGGALTETTGATGITGVQAPTFTGSGAAALAELPSGTVPAGVSGDVISTKLEYLKG